MIVGIGIEAVDVERFGRAIERWGERMTNRLFTESELGYCYSKRRPELHLAARFAGKVGLFRALGRHMRFRDVEILNDGDGRPVVKAPGLEGLVPLITISHDGGIAIAQVMIVRGDV